ncbi:hypothetical protein ABW16_22745 [Mycolicibacter heraklionensis]|uniref:DUF2236 domain-containing protein n=1 Tax=Mycolicibacter heraklionensis TaxID=512402 RepID=A0A9X7WIB7_9MYCO|nr:oxygenase MpaB family protein [Mycolicibacter heraklionensis]KLO25513.1 hypothetical protein ABW16_22745 [Mycolicibacter heraklionensis]QZA08112.1 DUF2236 domain-containing protein [Mycolicibacter heraklionensis]
MAIRKSRPPIDRGLNLADYVGEGFLYLGAGVTVLLQLAEPGVGHGVANHSTVLNRPLDRLRTTMTYIYCVTLGTDDERRALVKMVNQAHVPVKSGPDSPVSYNGFDPDLQLWVAATLYKNGQDLYERFLGPMDDATAERLYQQSAIYGTALQVKPEMWPPTRADFERYWQGKLDELTIDDHVRAFAHDLFSGREAPLPIRLAMPLNRWITRGLLPTRLREELHWEWSPRDQRLFDALLTVLPPVYRLVPRTIRWLPARYYLAEMRRRLSSGRRLIDEREPAGVA